jgi:thioredoxin 1
MTGFLKTLFGKKEEEASAPDAPTAAESVSGGKAVEDLAAMAGDAEPIHVTDESFGEVVTDSSLPVLVDFWAPWCGPCRMVAPVVEDLARLYDGRAVIAKMNTDENVQMASQLGIMGIPTLVLFKDGQEVDRVVGYAPQRVLEEKLNAALN